MADMTEAELSRAREYLAWLLKWSDWLKWDRVSIERRFDYPSELLKMGERIQGGRVPRNVLGDVPDAVWEVHEELKSSDPRRMVSRLAETYFREFRTRPAE